LRIIDYERKTLETSRSHIGGDRKKKMRDRRQEESKMRKRERKKMNVVRRTKRSELKEQEAEEHEGASRVEQWPKIAGQNQRGIKGIVRGGLR